MPRSISLPFVTKYCLVARVYPALITLVPLFILSIGLADSEMGTLVGNILSLQVLGCLSLNVAAFFLFIQVNRFIGKEVFESHIFRDELHMPTTTMLLPTSNQISEHFLRKLSAQTEKDFGLRLPTLAESQRDDSGARRRIIEIVAQMRQKVRDGHLLLQHNMEYGFARNLIGGAPLALAISIVDVGYYRGRSHAIFVVSVAMAITWLLLLLISKPVISRYGKLYAKRLIQEYGSGAKE